ncbi:MAG: hypothetical protein ACE366_06955 [Bradymonadia bacterium]
MMRARWLMMAALLGTWGCDDDSGGRTPPDAEVPDASAPDMAVVTPDAEIPDADLPDVEIPDADLPDVEIPDAEIPDMMPDAEIILAVCENGEDDDGDGLTDYPLDPGCEGPDDEDEVDPEAPACGDGADNDDDELIDLDDPGCASPADPSENDQCGPDQNFVDVSALRQVQGTTSGGNAVFQASCRLNNAPESVFLFTVREPIEALRLDTVGSAFDTILSVRSRCADQDSEVACNDDRAEFERTSALVLEQPALGDYYIFVDGFRSTSGPFTLNIRAELGEESPCDPEDTGPYQCALGSVCDAGTCRPAQCDNLVDDDMDGLNDFPEDPGCDTPDDDDETDPPLPPECSDGQDNNFNGLVDYPEDPTCESAADNQERNPPQCRDGRDNDNDGLVDLDDPGCLGDPDRNGEFNTPACRDGRDNDEDGLIDYPSEPGCTDRADPDERDPEVPPQCSNGIDEDGDGATDFPEDVDSCTSAADDLEDAPCDRLEIPNIAGMREYRGNTEGDPNDFRASCNPQTGADNIVRWVVAPDRPLAGLRLITLGSRFNTVLSVRDSCEADPDADLACDDNSGASLTSVVELGPQAAGTELFIVIDGGSSDAAGVYRLRSTALLAEGANCEARLDDAWQCADGFACTEQDDGSRICARAPCSDGLDNDEDGLTDFPNDPGCMSGSDDDEADPPFPPQCANGLDDDLDGLTDFGEDPRCESAADDFEGPDCSDGLDNDGDGTPDYDRDGDGFRDINADPQCACAEGELEIDTPQCNDGCDNDRDGLIDLEDPGCDDAEDDVEFNVAECRDLADNDQDGFIDFPDDPGCTDANDQFEASPDPLPECADGVDNDEDGRIDFDRDNTGLGDDGCNAASDDTELGVCDGEIPEIPAEGVLRDTTVGAGDDSDGTCRPGTAPDVVLLVPAPYPGTFSANTFGSSFDTALYARTTCSATTLCPIDEPEPEADAGLPDADVPDADVPDFDVPDADIDDAGVPDAEIPDVEIPDAELPDADMPCVPESTEIACNDDDGVLQSRVTFDWPGGDIYVFVDGFGANQGAFTLNVSITYPLGGQCGPDGPEYGACTDGTECRQNEGEAFPTCQPAP